MTIFHEKAAIVTGGASGIDRALAQLARCGASLILAAVNIDLCEETVGSLSGFLTVRKMSYQNIFSFPNII